MQNSKIEWCDHTFNPWWGCQRVSPGCEHCYAETLANRYGHAVWGPAKTTDRRMMSENYWRQPLRWNTAACKAEQRARVFCASMADWLEDHPALIEPRARLIQLIYDTPHLDWLLLTKRPEGWSDQMHAVVCYTHDGADMLASRWLGGDAPENVIIMTSVENQEYADRRIPELLKIPATRRGLSCEPLLGPLDLSAYLPAGIDWVIVGGESGHGARPMHPDWARSLRDQCLAAGAAYFFKQWGEYGPVPQGPDGRALSGCRVSLFAGYGTAETVEIAKLGKHAAGRLLDSREWNEVPR